MADQLMVVTALGAVSVAARKGLPALPGGRDGARPSRVRRRRLKAESQKGVLWINFSETTKNHWLSFRF